MYTNHFGLQDLPFSITPDPGYLYLSEYHREALAHLVYGIGENGGFVQLTGEVGTGKTTLIRALLAQNMPDIDVAVCLNPRLTVVEFVALIMDELGIAYPSGCESLKLLVDLLNEHLLAVHARGGRTVVIIDEAQNLCRDVLEQIRLLTNLETNQHKLLRIILVGQPELREMLGRQDLRQLAQRITARYHLLALNRDETSAYIRHRLSVAGAKHDLFNKTAVNAIYRSAKGIPRLINIICDRALLGAYASNQARVNTGVVKKAAAEVFSTGGTVNAGKDARSYRAKALVGAVALTVSVFLLLLLPRNYSVQLPAVMPKEAAIEPTPDTDRRAQVVEQVELSQPPAPSERVPSERVPSERVPSERVPSERIPSERVPPDNDLAAFLAASPSLSSGINQLLSLWQVDLDTAAGDDICAQLERRNFRCLSGSGEWATLKRYNRPAMITLIDAGGRRQEVLLETLSDDHAVLVDDNERIVVDLSQLDPLWTGEFFLIWQTPPYAELIGPGSRGEKVIWLRRQLAQIEQRQLEEPLSAEFDNNLLAQVKRFQREYELTVDGLAGSQTLQLLHSLAPAPSTPLLVRSSDEQKESG